MADSEKKVKIILDAQDNASKVLKNFGNQANIMGKELTSIKGMLGGVLGGAALLKFMKDSVDAFGEAQRVVAQTNAVIKSTGGAAGYTTAQIQALAKSIQATTPIADEAAQSGINMLLTFTKIGGDILPQATRAMVDMATAMNGGITPSAEQLSNTAIQLGKALNDPIQGITALKRVGVNFSDSQMKLITNLVDTNQGLKAQKMILDELSREFGGSAAAQLDTFAGQMKYLSNTFNDIQEVVGGVLVPALSYLANSFKGVGGAADAVALPFKVLAGALVGLTAMARVAADSIAIAWNSLKALVTGNMWDIGNAARDGNDKITNDLVDAQKAWDQIWSKHADTTVDTVNLMNKDINFDHSQASKDRTKQIADETRQFQQQMAKRKSAFETSLADMVRAHIQSVAQIKGSLSDENDSFSDTVAQRAKDYNSSLAQMKQDHQDNLDDINRQIKEETEKGNLQDTKKLADLDIRLQRENRDYQQSVDEKTTTFQDETTALEKEHAKRTKSLEDELAQEQDILKKHSKEVAKYKDQTVDDDITRLKKQYKQEQKEADAEHQRKLKEFLGQGATEGANYGAGFNSGIAGAKDAIVATGKDIGDTLAKTIADPLKKLLQGTKDSGLAKKSGPLDKYLTLLNGVTSKQHGGYVDAPLYEAVPAILHGGERVVPATGVEGKGSSNQGITINFTGPVSMDNATAVDELAKKVVKIIGRQNELARKGVAI